jgi:TP901-1 family phage major tail protein
MAAQRGSKLLIKRGDGADPEVFTTVGALQSSTWSINGNPIDVTTADDVDTNGEIWQTFITGPKSGTISGNGIGKAFEPIQSLYDDFATGVIRNMEIVVPNVGTWTAAFVITDMTFEGPYDGASGFSLTLQLSGAPVFVAET